uniref:Uncharacterized protein n=1 Tax=Onchocerca volvulus TaxID=6282 RepID=A0A8R1Y0P4_ONCVO
MIVNKKRKKQLVILSAFSSEMTQISRAFSPSNSCFFLHLYRILIIKIWKLIWLIKKLKKSYNVKSSHRSLLFVKSLKSINFSIDDSKLQMLSSII